MSIHRVTQVTAILAILSGAALLAPTPAAAVENAASLECDDMACYGGHTCEYHSGSMCDLDCVQDACITWNCDEATPLQCQ